MKAMTARQPATPPPLRKLLLGLALAFVSSCDGGSRITSLAGLQPAAKMLVSVESGGAQVLAPKQSSFENIVFTIRDAKADPVTQIAVEVRLIDITGVSDVTEEQLRAAWSENSLSISPTPPDPYATGEEIFGRLDYADSMTDSLGQIRVRVVAPESYSRTLAVMAQVLNSENGAYGFGYATYGTTEFGKDENFLLNTSNALSEVTGDSFSINLTAIQQGRIVKALNGKRRFNFKSIPSSRLSVTNFPEGEIVCNFIFGVCRIEGGPFTLGGFGELTVTFQDLDSNVVPGEAVITVERGKPSALVLSSTKPPILTILCHSRVASSEERPCLRMSADNDAVMLYPAIVDQGDNFMVVPLTNWSVSGPLKDRLDVAETSSSQVLQPHRSGLGLLSVRAEEFLLTAAYEVFPGRPSQHQIFSEHDGIESATIPFKIKSKVFDRKDNFCDNFYGAITGEAKLEGATLSPGGDPPVSSFSELLAYKAGEVVSTSMLLATRAGEKPIITLTTNEGVTRSQPLTVIPGPTLTAKWRTASSGSGRLFDAPVTLATDTRGTYYVAGYDKHSNFTANVDSTFKGTGALEDSLTVEEAFVTTIIPKITGVGTLIATPKLTSIPAVETPLISISSNKANAYDIITTNDNSEFSGERFQITIQAKDLNGFLADSYEGPQSLQFISYRPVSWTGQRALLPDGILSCTFVRGVCTVEPPAAETGWFVTNADIPALVSVKDLSGEVSDVWSDFIVPKLGLPDRIVFADKIGGEPAGAKPLESGILRKITADDSISLAAALVDRGGNYLGDANANWGGTPGKVAPFMAQPSPNSFNTFNAAPLITAADKGEIRASAPGVQDALMRVEVSHGVAHTIDIQFPGGTQVLAGQCIDFVSNVVDADKNQVTSYNASTYLGVGIKNATTGRVRGGWDRNRWGDWIAGTGLLRFVSGFYYPRNGNLNLMEGMNLEYVGRFAASPYRLHAGATMTGGSSDVGIIAGRVGFNPKVCLADATDVAPQIVMALPGVTTPTAFHPGVEGESPVLTVSKGPAFQVHFFGSNNEPLCPIDSHQLPPSTQQFTNFASGQATLPNGPTTVTNLCLGNRSVDLNPLEIIPHLVDAGGNDLGIATGSWSWVLPTAYSSWIRLPVASSIDLQTPGKLILGAKRKGEASIRFTDTATGIQNRIAIDSVAGAPKEFMVQPVTQISGSSGGSSWSSIIVATSPFAASFRLFDQFNNIVDNFDGSFPVNFAWAANPMASPIGTPARLATDGIISFKDGYGRSSEGFRLPRADVMATLLTQMPGLSPASAQTNITSRPGIIISMHLLDKATLSGKDIGNITISTDDDNVTWYAMGKDSEGNLTPNARILSTFTVNGILANDSDIKLNSVVLKPSKPGTANIQISTIDLDDLTSYPDVSSGTITVVEGRPQRFELQIADQPPGNQLAAGASYSLSVRMVDFDGNPIPSYTGNKWLNWDVADRSTNAESRSLNLPPSGFYTFVNGVCTVPLTLTPYASTVSSTLTVNGSNPTGAGVIVGSLTFSVDVGAFDHYGVATNPSYSPRSDLSTSFNARIYLRDASGNNLTSGGPNRTVSLRLVRPNGTPSTGAITGLTSGFNPSITGSVNVSNLRYDEAGDFHLIAEDGVYTTPLTASDLIQMSASPMTVKDYHIGLPTGNPLNLTAGQAFTMTVTARDNYNNPIKGADLLLSALSFTWQGPSPAPDGTEPTLSSLTFVNGVASRSVTFYRAETILAGLLNVRDNQIQAKSGAAIPSLIVRPGPLAMYDIGSSETIRTADQQASGLFNLSIQAFDRWHNPRSGDSALNLVAVYVSGSATSTGEMLGLSGTTSETTGLNLSSGSINLTGLRYLVPHTITFNVAGGSVGAGAQPVMTFTPTVHTVAAYRITAPDSVMAGATNTPVTVSARDAAGNVIASLDSILNSQSYTWSGAGSSFGGQNPVYGAISSFNGGSATATHSFLKAGTMVAQSLRIVDNYSTGGRSGGNIKDIIVNPLTISSLVIDPITTKKAGEGFVLSATVRDIYGNLTNNSCGTLTIAATAPGGTDSPGGHDGAIVPMSLSAAVGQDSIGRYITNTNRLFKEAVHSLTANACSMSATTSLTVSEADAANVYLSTTDAPPSTHLAAELLCPNTASNAGAAVQCSTLYAFFWDAYGNRVDDSANSCTAWSYANLSTGATVPTVSGSGHSLTLSHSSYLDGTLTCTKGPASRSVKTYGGVSRVDFNHNYTNTVEAALNNVTISSIQLYFRKNNVELAKTNAGTETITLSSNSTGNTVSSLGYASSPSCAFTGSGICATSYPLSYKYSDSAKTLTLTVRGVSKEITNINVTPNTATSLTVTANATQTAGTPFTASISANDTYGNLTAKGCTVLSVSGGTSSPGDHGGVATAPVMPGSIGQASVGQYSTGPITLYGKGSNTLTFSACSLTKTAAMTVNEAAANVVYLSSINSPPASHMSELRCANTSGASVACAQVYAFFWDAYGNQVDATASACSSWSYTNISGSGTPPVSGATHGFTLAHNSHIDGNLTCTKAGVSASVLTYGGVSRVGLTHNYTAPVVAALDNVTASGIQLFYRKNNVELPKADAGSQTITVSTSSTLGVPAIGQAASLTCAFSASGLCSTAYPFDMTRTESNVSITLTVRGVSNSIPAITVNPANASVLLVAAISSKVAGQAFTTSATVVDNFGNLTSSNCSTLSTSGGSPSPGAHGGTATAASLPSAAALSSVGSYTTGNITLYKEGSNTLTFNACGLSTNASVTVSEAAVNAVYLSSINSPPASHMSELRCANTTGASVSCAQVYAFFWDAYGNQVDDAASTCSSWSYTNISGSGTPGASGATHGFTLAHNNFIDGNLTCTKAGVSASVLTYGGVSRVGLTHNYTAPVVAALDNITASGVQLYYRKNNVELPKADAGPETITVSTSSTLGVPAIGQAASLICAFSASGLCSTAYPFDMTRTESNVSITLSVRGVSSSIPAITVNPANASVLTLAAISSKVAGQAFTTSASVVDSFGNLTSSNCSTLSTSGGTTSPGAYGGTATAASLPPAAALSSVGSYTTGPITLYNEGNNILTFSACGLSANAIVTITEAAAQTVYLNNTDTIPASSLGENHCLNSTGAAVSCPTIYAFFWDAYGNRVDDTASTCSSWSYTNISGESSPAVSGTSHSYTLTHSGFVDGRLTCTKGSASASVLTYGGISRMSITNTVVSSPLLAALNNFTVNSMQLHSRKNNVEINKSYSAVTSETIAVATDSALTANGLVSGGSYTCSFSTSGACTTAKAFSLTKAEVSKYISLTVRGKVVTVSPITIEANSAHNLTTTITSTQQAGAPFTASLTLRDEFNNTTTRNCGGDLTVTTSGSVSSPGGHGGSMQSASLPVSTAVVSGTFTSGPITLYKEGTNRLIFTACTSISSTADITVTEGPVNAVYLATSNAAPETHSSSVSCGEGTTVTCPALYAFAWDAYGNEISDGVYSCPSWTYVDSNSGKTPAASLSMGTGHSTTATNSTWHINGTIRCTASSVQANTTVFGRIQKTPSWTCGNWSCPSTTPTASCTVTNNTGYASSAYSFSGQAAGTSLDTTACDNGLAPGANCTVTVSGTPGSASGLLAMAATPLASEAANVTMLSPSAVRVNAGSNAPNCTNNLTQAITTDWSCSAGAGRFSLSLTNNNGLRSAILPNTDPIFSPVTGASLVSNTCKNITLGSGASCTATVSQPVAGVSTNLNFAPSDGYFQNVSVIKSPSPNCSQSGALSVSPTVAKASSCAATTPYVRLTFTVTNINTLNSMSFGPSPLTMANGTVISNTCNTTVAPGASCNFVMEWNPAPTMGTSTTSITLAENSAYFNDVLINSATANNSCP